RGLRRGAVRVLHSRVRADVEGTAHREPHTVRKGHHGTPGGQHLPLRDVPGDQAGRRSGGGTEGGAGTVLPLHSLAMSGGLWQPLVDRLAEPAIAMDARGHGESTWDGSTFTVEDLAADVAALIEARADGPVAVGGMSMGGCVAVALAG